MRPSPLPEDIAPLGTLSLAEQEEHEAVKPAVPEPKLRWYQYSLRTLLTVVLILRFHAVGLAGKPIVRGGKHGTWAPSENS